MDGGLDRRSFILGMVTAFCECVAGGCKRLALSPPLTGRDYETVADEACEIIEKHGLIHYHEKNEDRGGRFEWILIARRQATLDEYLSLRARGLSPVDSLGPFYGVLSYNETESVHTGYDAFRELFGGAQAEGNRM